MKFHSFLIKYGEIGIKGKNRYIFEDALVRQIRYALQGVDGEFLVHKCHGRVYVDCDGDYDFEETVESLQKVFGIVGICPVVRVPVAELEQLRKDVVAYVDEAYEEKNMTFKVDARRAKKSYPANSMEINCEVGEAILEAFPEMKVDVHKPELRINVEIREEVYIYEKCPHDELTIIMRRYMMKIAEHFAKKDGCLGLITGESIGQVASQTMQSLAATNAVCTLPVYRPLIGFDKKDIVEISEKINTYETSIQPFEDCCTIFVAKHPVTKPNIERIEKSELNLAEKIDELMQLSLIHI